MSASAAPVINELMAVNRQTLADEDGAYSDWIELYNPDNAPVDLSGWYLTDEAANKTKWQFPAVSIPANGYLVVFASDKDRRTAGANLHTNFALSSDGEYIGLIAADGATVVSEIAPAFPAQTADVAYGRSASGTYSFLTSPTPGAANSDAALNSLSLTSADGSSVAFSSLMPILVLDDKGAGELTLETGEKEGSLQIVAGSGPVNTAAGLKVRGSSSSGFPKKSYSIELHTDAGKNNATSLLGMAKVADWALVSPWNYDPSYLRNAYVYALSNSLGRWAPHTRFTEYFLKTDGTPVNSNDYAGIGVLTERIKIDSNLVDIKSLATTDVAGDEVTGGYILKIDPQDDDEFGWTTDHGIPSVDPIVKLVVAYPKAEKLANEQRDYIQGYVQAFENALFADRANNWATRDYLGYIDRPSWVDFHLLQVLTKNPDGLIRSAYFTKDRGGKLKAGPVWDFDRAMGSVDPRSQTWDEWSEGTGADLWNVDWWGAITKDPDFMQAWIDRWQSLRRGELSTTRLTTLANSLAAQIDPAAAERDAARWPENGSRFGNYRGEVDNLISWLTNRAAWIDQQFIAAPVAVSSTEGFQVSAPAGMQVVYTTDGSDPRASGGAVAANALNATSTVTVPAGATVRLYDPAATGVVIGSAWSSAIVISSASIVSPITDGSAQLNAFSTRATLSGPGAKTTATLTVSGEAAKTYLVRAVGGTLSAFGVENALADPMVTVLAADGSTVATNIDWHSNGDAAALAQQSAASGAFPLDDASTHGRDAALVVTLAPGTYTVETASASGAAGTVLAEAYAMGESSLLTSFRPRMPSPAEAVS